MVLSYDCIWIMTSSKIICTSVKEIFKVSHDIKPAYIRKCRILVFHSPHLFSHYFGDGNSVTLNNSIYLHLSPLLKVPVHVVILYLWVCQSSIFLRLSLLFHHDSPDCLVLCNYLFCLENLPVYM